MKDLALRRPSRRGATQQLTDKALDRLVALHGREPERLPLGVGQVSADEARARLVATRVGTCAALAANAANAASLASILRHRARRRAYRSAGPGESALRRPAPRGVRQRRRGRPGVSSAGSIAERGGSFGESGR